MLRWPFRILAGVLVLTTVCPILLPLALLIGYPSLVVIGLGYAVLGATGRLERPAEVAAVWAAYLGLFLTLQGIVICFDTALAGAPPTAGEKRFGTRLAYLGGGIAGVSALLAYGIDLRHRADGTKSPDETPLDNEWA
ncbi:hypothetical protein AB1L88_24960 [Tautonia sp. JC769]|uniref:hypothetical protein n=1 Tax=Tautonia sp. JC769 TaxID=3232135 RepID=UPI003458318C